MCNGHDHGAEDLGVCPVMLHFVIIALGTIVGCVKSGAVVGDAVSGDAL